jgi:hypothetical protein
VPCLTDDTTFNGRRDPREVCVNMRALVAVVVDVVFAVAVSASLVASFAYATAVEIPHMDPIMLQDTAM